jgi:hypothetical protein
MPFFPSVLSFWDKGTNGLMDAQTLAFFPSVRPFVRPSISIDLNSKSRQAGLSGLSPMPHPGHAKAESESIHLPK